MASTRIHLIIFAMYSIATILVGGKAIDDKTVSPATTPPELPPLIFPKNNIMPINKTALKILLHEDDLANSSSSSMTKNDKDLNSSGEADDLQRTDQQIFDSEEERANEFKLHHLVVAPPPLVPKESGFKDQVEYFQDGKKQSASDLEEQYNRQPQQNFMSVSITHMDVGKDMLRDHLAVFSIAIVLALTLSIFGVLMFWRHKLEQRYGNRHRLFNDEDSVHDVTL